ncbi:hypothetical protein FQA18_13760 [Haloferax volcanii]|uniref:Uncharacterized protein n=1 Tax=Haloferax volcanii TaxID=2246 RepID=A0A558G8M3_HALVO|nr:hypothetical protein FQA18_13760 [Haloferax volcanii]
MSVALLLSFAGVASGGPASIEDCELENRVECLVAWLVDENAFVGHGNHVGANLRALGLSGVDKPSQHTERYGVSGSGGERGITTIRQQQKPTP